MKKTTLVAAVVLIVYGTVVSAQPRTGAGRAEFFDSTAYSDAFRISMTGVSAPSSGKVFVAWLGADDDVQYLKLGELTVQGSGTVSFVYKNNSDNLLASNKKFLITEENSPFSGSTPTLSSTVFVDSLHGPGTPSATSALKRIRNCIVSFSNTKQGLGLAIWLKIQSPGIIQHAGFSRDGAQANTASEAKMHADHVFDFIRGQLSGLVSNNSSVAEAQGDPVGHGFRRFGDSGTHDSTQGGAGFLGGAGYYVSLVVNDPTATANMKKEGGSALLALTNALGAGNDSGWAKEVTDRAVNMMNGIYSSGLLVTEGTPFYNLALKFINGTVGPTDTASATGGITQAYVHMQRMASFEFDAPLQPVSAERMGNELPDGFEMNQNYPNPFNGITTITFHLAEPGRVELRIYNLLGQEIAHLLAGREFDAGKYSVRWNSGNAVSGMYVYELKATTLANGKTQSQVRQMILLK